MEPPVAPLIISSRSIDDLITAGEDDYSPYTQEDIRGVVQSDNSGILRVTRSAVSTVNRSVRYAENDYNDIHSIPSSSTTGSLSVTHPPSFNDSVKRSTRFITAVPASEVLDKVESILEQVKLNHVQTPIGIIGKIAVNWTAYRIDVWGADCSGPPLCALQLYQMPATTVVRSESASPSRNFSPMSGICASPAPYQSPYVTSGGGGGGGGGSGIGGRMSPSYTYMSPFDKPERSDRTDRNERQSDRQSERNERNERNERQLPLPLSSSSINDSRRFSPSLVGSDGLGTNSNNVQQLFLAEFVRGQLEIFAFKRFYQWVRQRLSQLVKRDYAFKLLDQGGSPM